jgi:hypothetical protein
MSAVIDKNGKILEQQKKRYSVIILTINSIFSNSPKKRLLNFYSPIRHKMDGNCPNELA